MTLFCSYNIAANIDPKNAGVLLVHLQGGGGGAPQGAYRDAGFTRELAQNSTGDDENVSRSPDPIESADLIHLTRLIQCSIM